MDLQDALLLCMLILVFICVKMSFNRSSVVCLVTLRPNHIYCEFLNSFTRYKVFVIVDDNDFDLTDFRNKYKNLTFIQIENKKCEDTGYRKTCMLNKEVTGWSKALYYFGVHTTMHEQIWFMEDDVFFYNEDTLLKLDTKYTDDDLLSRDDFKINKDGKNTDWHWPNIKINLEPPYHSSMMCCVRVSRNLMNHIHGYATQHNTLFFIEPLFPTIAMKNNMKHSMPNELNTIHWQHDFKQEDIDVKGIYHPVKDMNKHVEFRENMK